MDLDANRINAVTADGQWERSVDLGEGVRLAAVLPGVPPPRFLVRLDSSRGRSLTVGVDPLTGTPQIDTPLINEVLR